MILGYGFSINANPFDHYAVGFKVPPGSPLAEARSWRADQLAKANKRSKTDDEYRYYIFNAEHPRTKTANSLETSIFSQDLFDSISVLSANFRELQSDRFKSTGSVLDLSRKRLTDVKQHRNVLHTLCQLRLECSRRAEAIKAAISKLNVESSGALFQKQQYARFYRDSQLQILETATLLCRYCLFKAQNPARQDADLIGSAAAAERMPRSSEAQENVQELVRKMPSVINIRILFSFPDAVELLPANLASKVRHTTEVFRSALDKKSVLQVQEKWAMAHGWEEKIGFTVLLAELRELYSGQSTALSTHLQAWMMKLQKWYSFDDAFWNNPTEDFLPALEAMVEAANLIAPDANDVSMAKGWSEPHMLCWGWNVQEEEGLFSETEVLATEADGSSVQPSGYLLCITGGFGSNGLPN